MNGPMVPSGPTGPSGPPHTGGGNSVVEHTPARRKPTIERDELEAQPIRSTPMSRSAITLREAEKRIASFFAGSHRVRQGVDIDCPFCGSAMVVRLRGRDKRSFLGCMTYPRCSGSWDIPDEAQAESKKWEFMLMTSQRAEASLEDDHPDAVGNKVYCPDFTKYPDFTKTPEKEEIMKTEEMADELSNSIKSRLARSAAKAPYRMARMRALTNGKKGLLAVAKSRVKPATYDIIEAFLDTDAGQGAIIGLIGLAGPMTPKLGKNKHVQAMCEEFLDEGVAKGFNQVLSLVAMIVEPALESAIAEIPGVDVLADKVVPKRRKKRVSSDVPSPRVRATAGIPEEEEEGTSHPLRAVHSRS